MADGTPEAPTPFVRITTTGQGAGWTPEPVDATWRDLAELDLADPIACQTFARRRGDPAEKLSQGRDELYRLNQIGQRIPMRSAVPGVVTTSQWERLALALRQAALAWDPADHSGVSHFNKTRRQTGETLHQAPGRRSGARRSRGWTATRMAPCRPGTPVAGLPDPLGVAGNRTWAANEPVPGVFLLVLDPPAYPRAAILLGILPGCAFPQPATSPNLTGASPWRRSAKV